MRCNQVSIRIERFGEFVPKAYPADVQRISVYADDFDSIYTALSKAYAMAINELDEYDHICCRANVRTNEFSRIDYRETHATLPKERRKYEEDVDFEYTDSQIELVRDYIWVYEHSDELLTVIKECDGKENVVPMLKERFGLNDFQIRKLSQIRLEMLEKSRYERAKEDLERLEKGLENQKRRKMGDKAYTDADKADKIRLYNSRIRKLQREVERVDAHLKAIDNYADIISIVIESEDYYKIMAERYGFTYEQSRIIRYATADEYSQKKREELIKHKQSIEKDIEMTKNWIKKAEGNG